MTMQKQFAMNLSNTSAMAQDRSSSVFYSVVCAVCVVAMNMLFVMDAAIMAASISIISIIIIAIIIMAIIRRTSTAQCVDHRNICTA